MAKTSMNQLKKLAQKFDVQGNPETFEQVWQNVLEFKDKSDRVSRECGHKIHPSNIKWTRKDKEDLK